MEEYEQIIMDFDVDSKITNIITDIARNMIFFLPKSFEITTAEVNETD